MAAPVDSPVRKRKLEEEGTVELGPPAKIRKSWRGREVVPHDPGEITHVTPYLLQRYHISFKADPTNRLVQNALTRRNLHDIALNYVEASKVSHQFSHLVDMHPRATDQKSSGRCWMFAMLNCMRIEMMREHDLPDSFEFSQTYLYFFDKIEKANTFLNRMIEWAEKPLEGDEVRSQLSSPVYDGGGWTMCSNLIKKYGIVPKSAMPETYQSENSAKLNDIINYQLRQFTLELRNMVQTEKPKETIHKRREEMLATIYHIVAKFLGEPPKKFSWEFRTKKEKTFVRHTDLTPVQFYEEHVPYKVEDKVLMINVPSPKTPFGKRYASWCENNTEEGSTEVYLNLPYEKILPFVAKSIQEGEPVYFSCDVKKQLNLDLGAMAIGMFDYQLVFHALFSMTKEDRIATRQSGSSHAMVLCGVNLDEGGDPDRWCIENSWGKSGHEGYLSATQGWMQNYSFKFAIDRKYLPADIIELADSEPIQMERTDPI